MLDCSGMAQIKRSNSQIASNILTYSDHCTSCMIWDVTHGSSTKSEVKLKHQIQILLVRWFQVKHSSSFYSPTRWLQHTNKEQHLGTMQSLNIRWSSWPLLGLMHQYFPLPFCSMVLGPLWHFVSSKASIKAIWLGIDWLGSLSPNQSPFGQWAQRGCRPESYQSQHKAPSTLS